jgi:hypothetical protein
MKLENIFTNGFEAKIKEYILLNVLYGALGHADREQFLKFYKESKDEFKATAYINKMPPGWSRNFWHENSTDLDPSNYKITGNEVEFINGFVLYIYDIAGPPPFTFKKNFEIYSFGVFNGCKLITEFPSWFPKHMDQYQQVGTSIKSLKNIHKVIQSAGELYFGKDETIRDVSYIAGIKNLVRLEFSGNPELTKSVNKYLRETPVDERDILDLQDHLIDNEFKDYA